MKLPAALGVFLLFPLTASAAVVINEIAWMGTAVSSADEWIELRNLTSEPVDLSGWTLASDDGSPSIALSGTLVPNGYFLIERTDDESVPGIAADLVAPFGNGLSNTGEILRLRDASGAVVDTVDGSGNWAQIGGDNATKETAQRTASGWTTAPGTPRAENAAPAALSSAVDDSGTASSTNALPSTETAISKPKPGPYPRANITASAGEDIRAFSRMPVRFTGDARGIYDENLEYANYRWNFGDGTESTEKNPIHIFRFPGEYIVSLQVRYGGMVASDRLLALIEEPELTIVETQPGDDGFVALRNFSGREIDLSGWTLEAGAGAFVFPANSFILPGRTLKLANERTGLRPTADATTTLRLPGGAFVASMNPKESHAIAENVSTFSPVTKISAERSKPAVSRLDKSEERIVASGMAESSTSVQQTATVLWAKEEPLSPLELAKKQWFLLAIVVVLIAGAGFLLFRSEVSDPVGVEEYTIIEDLIEGDRESFSSTK